MQMGGHVAVKLPFETCGVGDGYACPGPVTVRRLSKEEQERYPPVRPTRQEMEADMAAGLTATESARKWGISLKVWVQLAKQRGIEVKKQKDVDVMPSLGAVAVGSEGQCMVGDVAAEESFDKLVGEKGAPTHSLLECLRRGLPIECAQRMKPVDLTKEMVEELLARGASKVVIMRAYGFRADRFYSQLRAWGLATGPELRSKPTRKMSAVAAKKVDTTLSLGEAIKRMSRLRDNVEACARLLTLAREHGLATDDIVTLLQDGRAKWEVELDRLGQARVVM